MKASELKKKGRGDVLRETGITIPREAAEEDGAEYRTTAWLFRQELHHGCRTENISD